MTIAVVSCRPSDSAGIALVKEFQATLNQAQSIIGERSLPVDGVVSADDVIAYNTVLTRMGSPTKLQQCSDLATLVVTGVATATLTPFIASPETYGVTPVPKLSLSKVALFVGIAGLAYYYIRSRR